MIQKLLQIFINHRSWFYQQIHLIPFTIYSFLRIISGNGIDLGLRKDLAGFCSSVLLEKFKECTVIGRDLIRILQDVSKMPEFAANWKFLNQKSMSDSSTESTQLYKILQVPTPKRFLATRLTPEMETNLLFILDHVKYGGSHHRKYYEWFAHEYLKVADPDNLIIDIIRYLIVSYHPPNAVLASSSVQRWQIITWFLRQMKTNYSTANAKLALFYDWLFYDPAVDNIMNVEPAILIIAKSASANPKISCTMIEFLYILKKEYLPSMKLSMEKCIDKTMFDILSKRVIANLESILLSDQISEDIKVQTKELFPCYMNLNSLKQSDTYNSPSSSTSSIKSGGTSSNLSLPKVIDFIGKSLKDPSANIIELTRNFVEALGSISDSLYENYEQLVLELIRDKFNSFKEGNYREWSYGLTNAFNDKTLEQGTIDRAIERLSFLPIPDFDIESLLIYSVTKSNESIHSDVNDDGMCNGIEDQLRHAKASDSRAFYSNCFNQFYLELSESPKIIELLGVILEDTDPKQLLCLKDQLLTGSRNPLTSNWSNIINSLLVSKDWDGYCQMFLWELLSICFKQVPDVLASFRGVLQNLKSALTEENSEICNGIINLALSFYPRAISSNSIATNNDYFTWMVLFLEEGPSSVISIILTFYWRSNSRSFLQSLVRLDEEGEGSGKMKIKKLHVKETLMAFSKYITGLEENTPAKKSLLSCIDTTIALMSK